MQGIEQRLRLLLPDGLALIGAELLDLALDLVDSRELLQRELGDLALIGRMQIEELAPCWARQPTSVTPLAIKAL